MVKNKKAFYLISLFIVVLFIILFVLNSLDRQNEPPNQPEITDNQEPPKDLEPEITDNQEPPKDLELEITDNQEPPKDLEPDEPMTQGDFNNSHFSIDFKNLVDRDQWTSKPVITLENSFNINIEEERDIDIHRMIDGKIYVSIYEPTELQVPDTKEIGYFDIETLEYHTIKTFEGVRVWDYVLLGEDLIYSKRASSEGYGTNYEVVHEVNGVETIFDQQVVLWFNEAPTFTINNNNIYYIGKDLQMNEEGDYTYVSSLNMYDLKEKTILFRHSCFVDFEKPLEERYDDLCFQSSSFVGTSNNYVFTSDVNSFESRLHIYDTDKEELKHLHFSEVKADPIVPNLMTNYVILTKIPETEQADANFPGIKRLIPSSYVYNLNNEQAEQLFFDNQITRVETFDHYLLYESGEGIYAIDFEAKNYQKIIDNEHVGFPKLYHDNDKVYAIWDIKGGVSVQVYVKVE